MIFGIGTDLATISRIDAVWQRHGERFVRRLLHPREVEQFRSSAAPARFLAKSWAVKEAFGKALGTGVRGYENPEVGISRGAMGRPGLVYSARMQARLEALGIVRGHVSISDEEGLVNAFVVLESAPLPVPVSSPSPP